MRLKEALAALNGLIEKKSRFSGTALAIPLARNRRELEGLQEGFNDLLMPSEKIREYQTKRQELVEKHGKMQPVDGKAQWVIDDEKKLREFQMEVAELRKEYAEAIAEHDAKVVRAEEELKKEVTVNLQKIKEKDLPKDLNDEEVYILLPFIE